MRHLPAYESDILGGSGRAAYRLHAGLLGISDDSGFLVVDKAKGSDIRVDGADLFGGLEPQIEGLPIM